MEKEVGNHFEVEKFFLSIGIRTFSTSELLTLQKEKIVQLTLEIFNPNKIVPFCKNFGVSPWEFKFFAKNDEMIEKYNVLYYLAVVFYDSSDANYRVMFYKKDIGESLDGIAAVELQRNKKIEVKINENLPIGKLIRELDGLILALQNLLQKNSITPIQRLEDQPFYYFIFKKEEKKTN